MTSSERLQGGSGKQAMVDEVPGASAAVVAKPRVRMETLAVERTRVAELLTPVPVHRPRQWVLSAP